MNSRFLQIIKQSHDEYLISGARSNKKLIILHGAIASDLQRLLGKDYFVKSLGFGDCEEGIIKGRYIDKKVDIVIGNGKKLLAGVGVKFVMSNYLQNANNYFENMLGETANIRAKNIPYFQILIMSHNVPYFDKSGKITKIETISNLKKYIQLSNDNVDMFFHTPNKTLLIFLNMDADISCCKKKDDYIKKCAGAAFNFCETKLSFGDSIIFNDYAKFIEKVSHYIKSI